MDLQLLSTQITEMNGKIKFIAETVKELKIEMNKKRELNGIQNERLSIIETNCKGRGMVLNEVKKFKDNFLWILISGNILTAGVIVLYIRFFRSV